MYGQENDNAKASDEMDPEIKKYLRGKGVSLKVQQFVSISFLKLSVFVEEDIFFLGIKIPGKLLVTSFILRMSSPV